jgi:hypothetical protein
MLEAYLNLQIFIFNSFPDHILKLLKIDTPIFQISLSWFFQAYQIWSNNVILFLLKRVGVPATETRRHVSRVRARHGCTECADWRKNRDSMWPWITDWFTAATKHSGNQQFNRHRVLLYMRTRTAGPRYFPWPLLSHHRAGWPPNRSAQHQAQEITLADHNAWSNTSNIAWSKAYADRKWLIIT